MNITQIIKAVMTSAAEAEIGAMYINSREAVPQIMTLSEMDCTVRKTLMFLAADASSLTASLFVALLIFC